MGTGPIPRLATGITQRQFPELRRSASHTSVMNNQIDLNNLEERFSVEDLARMGEARANKIVEKLTSENVTELSPSRVVRVATVRTYIVQKGKGISGMEGYVFPPFARHWVVIVGPEDDLVLYHLTFVDPNAARLSPPSDASREVQFSFKGLSKLPPDANEVGTTTLDDIALRRTGKRMIQLFGNYHRVFWNCQVFANCYLRVITGNEAIIFPALTSGDTTNLVLCAFLVGAPMATTNRKWEKKRVQGLLNRLTQTMDSTTASVEQASDQAISFILDLAITHPQTKEDLKAMEEGKGVIPSIIKYFFG